MTNETSIELSDEEVSLANMQEEIERLTAENQTLRRRTILLRALINRSQTSDIQPTNPEEEETSENG